MAHLAPLTHPDGVLFDEGVDNTFAWEFAAYQRRLPWHEPWVGVVHNPPNMPEGDFAAVRPQRYTARAAFQQSLKHCRGLFALSTHQAAWFKRFGIPVEVLRHPADFDVPQFRWARYDAAQPRRVLHIGWWLRRLQSFSDLIAPDHRKTLLRVADPNAERAIHAVYWHDVELMPYQSALIYDRLLQQSVVFAHLVDASANNVVLDCIARATPLLINRHPAVEEYLGADYPLLYTSLEEATTLLLSDDRLHAAHAHLADPAFRQRFAVDRFVDAIRTSAMLAPQQRAETGRYG